MALMPSACSWLLMSSFCSRLPSKPVSRASKFSSRGVAKHGSDLPVILAHEALDLGLAVADEPECDRLDSAGGAGARKLAPKHWGQGEPDEIVERPARQVGVYQRRVDVARVCHRVEHGLLRDRVEYDPPDRLVLQRALLAQHFQDVPGNRLAFTIGVGGEDEAIGVLHRLGDLGQALVRRRVDGPRHREILIGQNRTVLRRQVAHVSNEARTL